VIVRPRITLTLLMWVMASVTEYVQAQDPNSITDYLKSTGRDSSFASRSDEYQKLHPEVRYRGTAAQNRELLGVLRLGEIIQSESAQPTFTLHVSPRAIEELMQNEVAEQIAASPKLASNTNSFSWIESLLGKEINGITRLRGTTKVLEKSEKALRNSMDGDPIRSFSEPINQARQKARDYNRTLREWKNRDTTDWLGAPPTSGEFTKSANEQAASWLANHAEWVHEVGTVCSAANAAVNGVRAWDSLDGKRVLSSVSALDTEAKNETMRELTKCQELAKEVEPQIRRALETQRSFNRDFFGPIEKSPPTDSSSRKISDRDSAKVENWWRN
jgi:hypothetical protein